MNKIVKNARIANEKETNEVLKFLNNELEKDGSAPFVTETAPEISAVVQTIHKGEKEIELIQATIFYCVDDDGDILNENRSFLRTSSGDIVDITGDEYL